MFLDRFTRNGFLDDWDEYRPDTLPAPGAHLDGHDVLTGERHLELHRSVRDVFERRGVYDAAYGYNLARLNLDTRFPDAGLRYAVEERPASPEQEVLRVAFTPTSAVCPETVSLAPGILRALTAEAGDVGSDRVRVRVTGRYQHADRLNAVLRDLEQVAQERGSVPAVSELDDEELDALGPSPTKS